MIALHWSGRMESHFFYALAGGGAAGALVGYLDDRGRIGIAGRFTVHNVAAVRATAWLGGMTEIHRVESVVSLGLCRFTARGAWDRLGWN